eukprot:c17157_g1_i1.p1 GENE.c17157_g1_i1~~c17157_g1_i1.p1  ORF type:complete len:511 (-),score=63.12 c17157_g1_i1:54-1499(-)
MSSASQALGDADRLKSRKPYTITKQREVWTDAEHNLFVEGLQLYDRDWKRIEGHVKTKTVIQIRSHAQKYFLKLKKQGSSNAIPPPRPKRKSNPGDPHGDNKRTKSNGSLSPSSPKSDDMGTPGSETMNPPTWSGANALHNAAMLSDLQSSSPTTSPPNSQSPMDMFASGGGFPSNPRYFNPNAPTVEPAMPVLNHGPPLGAAVSRVSNQGMIPQSQILTPQPQMLQQPLQQPPMLQQPLLQPQLQQPPPMQPIIKEEVSQPLPLQQPVPQAQPQGMPAQADPTRKSMYPDVKKVYGFMSALYAADPDACTTALHEMTSVDRRAIQLILHDFAVHMSKHFGDQLEPNPPNPPPNHSEFTQQAAPMVAQPDRPERVAEPIRMQNWSRLNNAVRTHSPTMQRLGIFPSQQPQPQQAPPTQPHQLSPSSPLFSRGAPRFNSQTLLRTSVDRQYLEDTSMDRDRLDMADTDNNSKIGSMPFHDQS